MYFPLPGTMLYLSGCLLYFAVPDFRILSVSAVQVPRLAVHLQKNLFSLFLHLKFLRFLRQYHSCTLFLLHQNQFHIQLFRHRGLC